MMEREIISYTLEQLKAKGMDASCSLNQSTKYEMNVETGKITLIRTVFNNGLSLYAIKDNKSGSYSVNKLDRETIDQAIATVVEIAESSEPDPAHAIAEYQPSEVFCAGPRKPDEDLMYTRLEGFLEQVKSRYPKIIVENAYLDFTHQIRFIANTNGTDFTTEKGIYRFTSMFSAHDGDLSSSFNYTGFAAQELDRELLDYGSLDTLLAQSCEQITTQTLSGKFVGDVIITPDCLESLLWGYVMTFLSDGPMIAGISPFQDKLGQKVASNKLTLSSEPVSPAMADGYFVTSDGFAAENVTLIEEGVLKSFLLSLYGSKKTGKERAKNQGGCFVIQPGDKSLAEMISQVKQGLLVGRYSGGSPSPNGDFSGVAKNSYYIEDGKIKYPVTETMIAGNMAEMFANIKEISAERIDYGAGLIPYMLSTGVTVSGK